MLVLHGQIGSKKLMNFLTLNLLCVIHKIVVNKLTTIN
jgi:hypothetical protein